MSFERTIQSPKDADTTLATIREDAWRMLALGSRDAGHGFHFPVLATTTIDGGPDARTVVLRGVDVATRELQLHTDARAGKLVQLQRDPRVCLVFHDAPSRTQLRLWGDAQAHNGDAAAAGAWQRLPDHSRALYDSEQRFVLLTIVAARLDWLLLDPAGHRRAAFEWKGDTVRALRLPA